MLAGKLITLGITGSIAAYKAAALASLLAKAGVDVHAVMTQSAQKLIAPATFQAITKNFVHTDMFVHTPVWQMPHIELAQKSDLVVVAPATANIIGKIANGIADDLLSTILMAVTCPVLLCPAMNEHMYRKPVMQANLARLKDFNYHVMEPETGHLACGTSGPGRFPEPEDVFKQIVRLITPVNDFSGLKVLVTAGGTREPLDPVRFLSNRSSGKMGFALSAAAASRGAQVTVVSAPTNLPAPSGVRLISVETAVEMREAVMDCFPEIDIVIKTAAVSDYRPVKISGQKIKKSEESLVLELQKNPDILQELGRIKQPHQILVGFAAETNNLVESARQKIEKKNLDLLIANDVTMPGAGFGVDTNIVKLIFPDRKIIDLPLMEKTRLADRILDEILILRSRRSNVHK